MKILLVGAKGTLGSAVAAELGARHDIIAAGRKDATVSIDLTDRSSIRAAFAQIGRVDAIVSAAGNVAFGALLELSPEQWTLGLNDKLMGQVNLALIGQEYLNDGGSITAISPF